MRVPSGDQATELIAALCPWYVVCAGCVRKGIEWGSVNHANVAPPITAPAKQARPMALRREILRLTGCSCCCCSSFCSCLVSTADISALRCEISRLTGCSCCCGSSFCSCLVSTADISALRCEISRLTGCSCCCGSSFCSCLVSTADISAEGERC